MMAKKVDERYQTADEVAQDLAGWLSSAGVAVEGGSGTGSSVELGVAATSEFHIDTGVEVGGSGGGSGPPPRRSGGSGSGTRTGGPPPRKTHPDALTDTVADFDRIATPGPTKKSAMDPGDSGSRKTKVRSTAGAMAQKPVEQVSGSVEIDLAGDSNKGEARQTPTLLDQRASNRIQKKQTPMVLWYVVAGMLALSLVLLYLVFR